MSDLICDLLNVFYEDIRPDLADCVFSAIKAAGNEGEFDDNPHIIASFSQLITLLATPQFDVSRAINIYMTDVNTRGSVTRPFFYHMTLPGNLYPEERQQYPAPPAGNLSLVPSFFPVIAEFVPPRIEVPEDFFDAPERIRDDSEARAPGVIPLNIILEDFVDDEDFEDDESESLERMKIYLLNQLLLSLEFDR